MQRELKRVPLDFNYPLNKVWFGYHISRSFKTCPFEDSEHCEQCKNMAELKGIPRTSWGCPDNESYFQDVRVLLDKLCEPPVGEGYQLWETVTEGSPMSPVFPSLEELCEWCSVNVPAWAFEFLTKEEWLTYFSELQEDK